jgi:hypothetical protein
VSKPDKAEIGSSGYDAWQEECDAQYKKDYDEGYATGRLWTRERGRRIFTSPEAEGKGRFEAAQVMFFESNLRAEVVVAILAATDRDHPELAVERAWMAARSAATVELSDPWGEPGQQISGSMN